MNEKRMGYRWKVDKILGCSLLDSHELCNAKIMNLTLKGAKVSSSNSFFAGEEVKLFIRMPDGGGVINALGKVVWNQKEENDSSFGIQFTKIKDRDRKELSAFIYDYFGEELKRKVWWQGIN